MLRLPTGTARWTVGNVSSLRRNKREEVGESQTGDACGASALFCE